MHEALRRAVRDFRMGMDGSGSAALIEFVDAFSREITAGRVKNAGELMPVLSEILAAQGRGDYLYVADLLEYEVARRLK